MTDMDKYLRRLEETLEELTEYPDQIINNAYLLFVLHDWWALAEADAETRGRVSDTVGARCLEILCPPLAVRVEDSDVYFLIHLNLDRSPDNIAHAVAEEVQRHSPTALQWTEGYSVMSVWMDDLGKVIAALESGGESLVAMIQELTGEE